MQFHAFFKNKFYWIVMIFIFLFIGLFIFTLFNEKFYQMPIGKVTNVQRINTQHVTDEQHNKDIKYKDRLTIQILNGKFEGAKSTITNDYVKSQADSERFSKNDKVLLHISKKPNDAYIIEKKRDSLVVLITGVFLITILLVGRQVGLQSILSLILNSIAVLGAIYIHNQIGSTSLFLLMVIAMIVSTTLTLLLVIGWRMRTLITIISTLTGTFLCIGIAELVIRMTHGNGIKYETMSFLTLPPKDVFLASVLIGSLGAVMDVAITIASGMNEILQRTPQISMKRWALAGRNIGQDIMGTMTNILLFSYLAGSLPMFLIYLKNANTITYTISMNWSLEVARALIGGIGIVLTIPITIALMELWFKVRGHQR
ncbi:YibE/F family protein [Staphylococcus pasteuri]|uniref:YibE/F family protein n=1 Tax=Staphylococcus pasteuri TaxID=45972 RepID=UPI002DBDACC2|nr:YibE/F family protein [Staphylococcus pasteuri]MEB7435173.1 YibE/F family protein [Staphylococcus pasteuri]